MKDNDSIEPKVQKQLIEQWLPLLGSLRKSRMPIHNLMIALIIIPLILTLAIIVYMFFKGFQLLESGIMVTFIGLSSVGFVYLGKLQACNDILIEIDFAVRFGSKKKLFDSISNIACYGMFKNYIKDVGLILKNG